MHQEMLNAPIQRYRQRPQEKLVPEEDLKRETLGRGSQLQYMQKELILWRGSQCAGTYSWQLCVYVGEEDGRGKKSSG